jgi:3-hydroxybutyryl-CoA dehydrogenase
MGKQISRVGIVGTGTIGRRVAFACVTQGVEARLFDAVPEAGESAVRTVRTWIEERARDGRLPEDTGKASRLLAVCSDLPSCVSDVDLVLESVPEKALLKRQVLAEIDRHAAPDALVGSNTSSIPASELADATQRPEKVFNINFGHLDDLKVEIMGHEGTAAATLGAVLRFVRRLELIPIQVRRDIRGYATNRIWRAVKKEALFLIAGGYITAEDIDRAWMLDWGTSVGPCGVMDAVGLDVVRDIEMSYFEASGDPSDRPPRFLEEMIAEGKLGVKTRQGFYKYPDPLYKRRHFLKGEKGDDP